MPGKSLYDKIWETRKARINAEQRLLRYQNLSDWLVPWISANLIIINLLPNASSNKYISIFNIYLSIIILIASIIINSKQFAVRAFNMKAHYIKLDSLLYKIKSDEKNISLYEEEYNSLLNQIENHARIDYLKLAIELKNNKDTTVNKLTWKDKLYYYFYNFIFYFFIASLFVLPLIFIRIIK